MRRRSLAFDERGVTSLEYAMIGILIVVAIVGALRLYVTNVGLMYNNFSTAMNAAF